MKRQCLVDQLVHDADSPFAPDVLPAYPVASKRRCRQEDSMDDPLPICALCGRPIPPGRAAEPASPGAAAEGRQGRRDGAPAPDLPQGNPRDASPRPSSPGSTTRPRRCARIRIWRNSPLGGEAPARVQRALHRQPARAVKVTAASGPARHAVGRSRTARNAGFNGIRKSGFPDSVSHLLLFISS